MRPVDPINNDLIRYRISPEYAGFQIKTDRNRMGFHRIPN